MKNLLLLLSAFFFYGNVRAQTSRYWQQQADVNMQVTLNDKDHSLDANLQLKYTNNSPDTLKFIWFHLWPNAYKNDRTAFTDQTLENGSTKFYFSSENQKGYINRLAFKVEGVPASTTDHPEHQDIIRLDLNQLLFPGETINIETPFHVKLPQNFSRGGHMDEAFQVTQWYPKPAVYDQKGWHPMPYLDQGEFYSEFGNYTVAITVPNLYNVAATGNLLKEEVKDSTKTLTYQQDRIHDFAWFADKDFVVRTDTVQLGQREVKVAAYFYPASSKIWDSSLNYIKQAIRTKSGWLGEYPYNVVTVVENTGNNTGGGMEYPTITLIETPLKHKELDMLINHEVGHNWFYGILASNEREHPWLDEGINSYYDARYARLTPTINLNNSADFMQRKLPTDFEHLALETITALRIDQPIQTASADFTSNNYGIIAYTKAAEWMALLENKLGTTVFDSCMKAYYENWKFKHPSPEDFKASLETTSGQNLDAEFNLLTTKGSLHPKYKKDVKLTAFFNLANTNKLRYICLTPALGFNYYDKLMLGLLIHNYTLPVPRFNFFAAPLYATGSKTLNGIARAGYTWFLAGKGSKLEISTGFARFNSDSFKDSTSKLNYQPFTKIVPSIKFTFANKNARSHVTKYVQLKTFLIKETGLAFTRDTVNDIDQISYPSFKRTVNQLKFVFENNRVLYPYDAVLQIDQGEQFVRAGITANYFFNYVGGGGMNVRFFAGKFFYTGDKTFISSYETDRYHLTLTGANGNEDYTYSNYFYGRNEFEGFASQQIAIRDGGFKVRTDLLSNKVGKTDNWLTTVNFTTNIPAQVDPFKLLPFKLPVKIFVDAGTYAEAWQKNSATGRFLFDAGLQLSLFRNSVNIYFPLLYSKVYKDYFKSTITEKRFSKNIAFSFDFQNISLRKLFPQLNF